MEEAFLDNWARTLDDREAMRAALDVCTQHIIAALVREAIAKVIKDLT